MEFQNEEAEDYPRSCAIQLNPGELLELEAEVHASHYHAALPQARNAQLDPISFGIELDQGDDLEWEPEEDEAAAASQGEAAAEMQAAAAIPAAADEEVDSASACLSRMCLDPEDAVLHATQPLRLLDRFADRVGCLPG